MFRLSQIWQPLGQFTEIKANLLASALADNGEVVAIAEDRKVAVYHYVDSKWIKKGNNTIGTCGLSGQQTKSVSLSLSANGQRLAVSANCGDSIISQVYQFTEGSYSYLGQSIDNSTDINLNADGTILAVTELTESARNVRKSVGIYKYLQNDHHWNHSRSLQWSGQVDLFSLSLFSLSGKGDDIVLTFEDMDIANRGYFNVMSFDLQQQESQAKVLAPADNNCHPSNPEISYNGDTIAYVCDNRVSIHILNRKSNSSSVLDIAPEKHDKYAMSSDGNFIAVYIQGDIKVYELKSVSSANSDLSSSSLTAFFLHQGRQKSIQIRSIRQQVPF